MIVIEGGDLVGKSALHSALFRRGISKEIFITDRGILTQILYSKNFNRFKEYWPYWDNELVDYLSNNGMIFLTATNETIEKRFSNRGDGTYKLKQILDMHKLYNREAEKMRNIPFVKVISTDNNPVEKIVKEIEIWSLYIKTGRMVNKVDNLIRLIEVFGQNELRNIRLQESSRKLSSNQFIDMMKYFNEYPKMFKENKHKEYSMAIEKPDVFHNAFKEKLIYAVTKEIEMNSELPLLSRRFHVTNDQGGCLNTLGINFRKNIENKVDMYITANFRSSDIVILPFDLHGIYNICLDIISPKIGKKLFKNKMAEKIFNFYVTINLESVHIFDKKKFDLFKGGIGE